MFASKCKIFLLLLLFLQTILIHAKDTSFEIFILTQHWPLTTCMDWKERSEHNACRLPSDMIWSLHGLWPTRRGEIAPNFCNDTEKFDPSLLDSIKPEMEKYWPDVEIRKSSLWEHEWIKHGTCAAQLPELDSELKYFTKGCELTKENPVFDWLSGEGVSPGKSYHILDVYNAVRKGNQGKNPHIDCDYIEGKHYIKEIKICFDKNFQRTDCDGILNSKTALLDEKIAQGQNMGTCPRHGEFIYPSKDQLDGISTITIIAGTCGTLAAIVVFLVALFVWNSGRNYRKRNPYVAL